MIDPRDLKRMAEAARKRESKRGGPSVGVVMRDCPCVRCDYNLKGVKFEAKCPECGLEVKRSIDPDNPNAEPWIEPQDWRPKWWVSFFGPGKSFEPKPEPAPVERKPEKPKPRKDLCGACGYDCTGVPPGNPCPECGVQRRESVRLAAAEVERTMQALSLHSTNGRLIAIGWALCGVALGLQWLSFAADASFGGVPWALSGQFLYPAAAFGAFLATIGVLQLFVVNPPIELRNQTATATRVTALLGPALWCLACAGAALGVWRDWDNPIQLAVHGGFLIASIFLAFHSRVMYVLASMVGRSEGAIQSSTLGFPIAVIVLLISSAWFILVGTLPLITFVGCTFIFMFCGYISWRFFYGNYDVGNGIAWSRQNLDAAVDRYRRKVERWRAQARADRDREKKFGSSASL